LIVFIPRQEKNAALPKVLSNFKNGNFVVRSYGFGHTTYKKIVTQMFYQLPDICKGATFGLLQGKIDITK